MLDADIDCIIKDDKLDEGKYRAVDEGELKVNTEAKAELADDTP